MKTTIFALPVFWLLSTSMANAQFAGDLFFQVPSVTATSGGVATLRMAGFFGAESPAAVLTRVTFPSFDVRVVAVRPLSTDFDERFRWKSSGDSLDLIAHNDPVNTAPIGTIEFFDIDFEVLAPAGMTIPLDITVRETLSRSGNGYPSSAGFSGQISVVSTPLAFGAEQTSGTPTVLIDSWRDVGLTDAPVGAGGLLIQWVPRYVGTQWEAVKRRVRAIIPPWIPRDHVPENR